MTISILSKLGNFDGYYNVSFVNPYSLSLLLRNHKNYSDIQFYVDGGVLATIFTFLTRKKINRISFDFTSIADLVFEECLERNLSLVVVGSDESSSESFRKYLVNRYLGLNVKSHHGYVRNEESVVYEEVIRGSDVLLIGMGAPIQEDFINSVREFGYQGKCFTCGGFIHQTAMNGGVYYPHWIDQLQLRWLYRIYREKGLWKRYFLDYPLAVFLILKEYIFSNKISVD